MSSAEDDYLEYRKQDPEFQRMVEEEMRKLTQELKDLSGADLGNFRAPEIDHSEKKQILHSPEKSYGISGIRGHGQVSPNSARKSERDEYLRKLTSKDADDGHCGRQISDAQMAKRDKQEAYAQQLRKQEEDYKQISARDSGRVSLHRQKLRPASPILVQKPNSLSTIGSYELDRSSPEAKRRQQQLYAQQLLDAQQASVIPTTRVLRNKPHAQDDPINGSGGGGYRMPSDVLEPMISTRRGGSQVNAHAEPPASHMLGSVTGVQMHEGRGDGVGMAIGGSMTDDQAAWERRRKQAEYARQLDSQRVVDYETTVKKYQEIIDPASPKSKKYLHDVEEYRASQQGAGRSGTGLNVGDHTPSSGRRSGRYVDPVEEKERIEKIERQRKYAEELAAGAALVPPENPHKVGSRPRVREQLPEEPNMFGARDNSERANKRIQQQQYYKQLQDAANQAPIVQSRAPYRRRNQDIDDEPEHPRAGSSSGRNSRGSRRNAEREREQEREQQQQGRQQYQAEAPSVDEMHSDAVQLARERMMRLRLEAERQQEADDYAEAERRYNAMKQSQQKSQEEQDAEDQAEAERRYYAMKQAQAEEVAPAARPGRYNEEMVSGSSGREFGSVSQTGNSQSSHNYGSEDQSPRGGKYYSGGGASRSGYRPSASDYSSDANAGGKEVHSSTTSDQYVRHEMKRHSDAPNAHSHGVIADYSQYRDATDAYPDPNDNVRSNPYNQHGDYRETPRNNHMNSIMSVGYEDDRSLQRTGSRGRMDSGRLSGRRSEATYGDDNGNGNGQQQMDPRTLKRLQQEQYRAEIAQAAAAVAPEIERHAVFKQEARYHSQGINLPGNHSVYGNAGYTNPHSHVSMKGTAASDYRSRGNISSGGGFQIG